MLIGYARVSTVRQDTTSQRQRLEALGVSPERVYVDEGLSGRRRHRPELDKALAACREGDTLVVTKLDRLARSVKDAADIFALLDAEGVALSIDGAIYDPRTPSGKLMLNILSMIAEFEADLISQRTREGMAIARQKGRLKGRAPKLSASKQRMVIEQWRGGVSQTELADVFGVSRRTIRRVLDKAEN